MGLFTPTTEIKEGIKVSVHQNYAAKYPEQHDKIFKVLEIDDEDFCELEWINIHAKERIVYIPKLHLQISK